MSDKPKYGVYDLSGPAIEKMRLAPDDNHAEPATIDKALENFRAFSGEFFVSQLEFLNNPKLK